MSPLGRWILLGAIAAVPAWARADDAEVEARFHDGTVVRRVLLKESLEIVTRYGALTVPPADIRRVEFGLHVSDEAAKKIEQAVKKLGSEQFDEREAASKELIAFGARAVQALTEAAKSKDQEVARRAQTSLERIVETVPEEQLRLKPEDVVYAKDCVLTGRIKTPTLKAKTEYFGDLQFKLSDLRSIHSTAVSKAEVTVDAAKFGNNLDKWVDSGFTVEADTGLVITAAGQVDLVPQQPGQFVSGPDGNPNAGQVGIGQFAVSIGALMGRIGEKGEPFIIGSRFEGRVAQGGKLYLLIVPVVGGGNPASGSYKVKASAGPQLVPVGREGAQPGGQPRTSRGPGRFPPPGGTQPGGQGRGGDTPFGDGGDPLNRRPN